jgi:hypothetical protein
METRRTSMPAPFCSGCYLQPLTHAYGDLSILATVIEVRNMHRVSAIALSLPYFPPMVLY